MRSANGGGRSMSVVYYVMDGEDGILVSAMQDRSKAKAVLANPKMSLCILAEQWPMTYVQVYCTATSIQIWGGRRT